MQPSAVTKIEHGNRKVDVGDLVALSVALDVTPNRLLLTDHSDGRPCALTPQLAVTDRDAWEWATRASIPLPWTNWWPNHWKREREDRERRREMRTVNNPHRPAPLTVQDAGPHLNEIQQIGNRIAELADQMGVNPSALIEEIATLNVVAEAADGER